MKEKIYFGGLKTNYMKKINLVVMILLLVGQVHFSFCQTTITMQNEGGVYVVPCSVNGIKLKFIFDTGASDVSISATEAIFMLKNGYLKSEDILGEQNYSNATGDISVGTIIILRDIEFAGLHLKDVRASVVHALDAPLLLGQTAIQKLGKYQMDGNTLTILNGANNTYTFSGNSSTITSVDGLPYDRMADPTGAFAKMPTYSGVVKVFTWSPILAKPENVSTGAIGVAENEQVTIIRRENLKYYYVKSGNTTGYLFAGWIKAQQ